MEGDDMVDTDTERPSMNFASEVVVRMAILDVFDSNGPDAPRFFFEGQGVKCASGGYEVVSEDTANAERLDFADAVQRRIRELQSPPHDGIRLENFCDRHKRSFLPLPTKSTCALCAKE